MKKGYDVMLHLTHRETVEIETEEEDESKIMDEARLIFVDGIRGTGDADDIIGDIEPVNIERNYSEQSGVALAEGDRLKTYSVELMGSLDGLTITVKAKDKSDAIEQGYDTVETNFISDNEKTECNVKVTNIDYVELIEPEKEPEQ